MKENHEILNEFDVISVTHQNEGRFASGDTFKVQQILKEYEGYMKAGTKTINNSEIWIQGIECEVLRHDSDSKGWKKGKIKFVVQFEPEEAENNYNSNSLDDIRQQLDSTN